MRSAWTVRQALMQRRMSLRETGRGVFVTERRKPCDSEAELGGVQL